MEGREYLKSWGVQDPDTVGASEYRAIWEELDGALTGCEHEVAAEPIDFALAILGEFISHAQAIKTQIESKGVKETKTVMNLNDIDNHMVAHGAHWSGCHNDPNCPDEDDEDLDDLDDDDDDDYLDDEDD